MDPRINQTFQKSKEKLDKTTIQISTILDKIIHPILTNPVIIWIILIFLTFSLAKSIVKEALTISTDKDIANMYVTAICNTLIAIITLNYVVLTNKAVKQTKIEQQIRDIERKLEKFYIPAIDILEDENNHIFPEIVRGRRENIGEKTNPIYIKNKGLNDIKEYRYLAEKDTSEKFDTFIKNESELRSNSNKLKKERENLKEDLKKDIEKLKNNLKKLKTQ